MTNIVAVDLGNESGRIIRIAFEHNRLSTSEVYRFGNYPVQLGTTLHWDVLRLWNEVQQGLAAARSQHIAGIAVDSFGVDFGLLDARDELIANPVHMRDRRTDGMMAWVLDRVGKENLYQRSGGIGFHVINTLYQLAALVNQSTWQLEAARTLLTIPNLFNFWLTGEKLSEFTHTTTTQCYNPLLAQWDEPTLDAIGVPLRIFQPVIQPGERIGYYQSLPVFAAASHDTASAVLAVPTETPHYAYLSSGTWSLLGIETRRPLVSAAAMNANISSEGGAYGTYRPLKLVMGLWIIQQCRVMWMQEGAPLDYNLILALAAAEPPFSMFIDPDDPLFFAPGDMPARVIEYCRLSDQPPPATRGQIVRCVMESLALKYRQVIEELIAVSGQPVEVIHIVGGGAQNPLLCQMTADATARPVLAGPVEATALGNGLVQLIALGEIRDIQEARAIVHASFPPVHYQPQNTAEWDAAYARFQKLTTS